MLEDLISVQDKNVLRPQEGETEQKEKKPVQARYGKIFKEMDLEASKREKEVVEMRPEVEKMKECRNGDERVA
ncbi:unnamed protein product [Microthlaspi erraticum]|uniref:Uncharacterized protein n=1 Tax=Microthlaspi erraticum TaxID=1685480 RepID=A0A6D2KJ65_9BRAS|nr:unnamed protein product [Microthlaspi erraticum]